MKMSFIWFKFCFMLGMDFTLGCSSIVVSTFDIRSIVKKIMGV